MDTTTYRQQNIKSWAGAAVAVTGGLIIGNAFGLTAATGPGGGPIVAESVAIITGILSAFGGWGVRYSTRPTKSKKYVEVPKSTPG